MHIVCPHCTTSYAIKPATLGAAGRTVRCSRCKETWLARPEDAIEIPAAVPAMAASGQAAENAAAELPISRTAPCSSPLVFRHGRSRNWCFRWTNWKLYV